ncbi:vinculin family domain-containing protein [Phthorimaea operculella]|nr:vinculin family domain-containing protein [Phthorimaea operculella]
MYIDVLWFVLKTHEQERRHGSKAHDFPESQVFLVARSSKTGVKISHHDDPSGPIHPVQHGHPHPEMGPKEPGDPYHLCGTDPGAARAAAGKSKRASALVATVERATEIFIERGQQIAYENPEITQEMLLAVEEVRKAAHTSRLYPLRGSQSAWVATVERATQIFIERGQQIPYENPEITQEMLLAVEEVRKAGTYLPTYTVYIQSSIEFSANIVKSALVATVERATEMFIERGQQIAYENPEITQEMLLAVEEVRKAGAAMSIAAREFSEEPCASSVRSQMVRCARALLSAVTRLLILADMVDVHLLLGKLRTSIAGFFYFSKALPTPQGIESSVRSQMVLSAVTRLLILADMVDVHLLLGKLQYSKLLLSMALPTPQGAPRLLILADMVDVHLLLEKLRTALPTPQGIESSVRSQMVRLTAVTRLLILADMVDVHLLLGKLRTALPTPQGIESSVRSQMVRLTAVTRLLILADMVDVHLLLGKLRTVETDLDKLKSASSQSELVESARQFGRSANELAAQAARRQAELKEPRMKDELAAARAVLKKHSTMLLTASKVYVRHPELAAAKANRDYVLRAVCAAVDTISAVAQGRPSSKNGAARPPVEGPGELAQALDDFDERMVMEPLAYSELRTRPSLEERLESIISGAALMADSSCTRDERRERIVAECNAVRQALQDLLHEYMSNAGKPEQSEGLERAIENMCRKTRDLRRQLRKAVVDHVSDSFLETNVPLLVLMEAARNGNEKEVEEYALVFTEHANKLVEVANLVCSMSNNEDGVKMVRHAAGQIEALCPQVINAARVLAARPRSRVAQENASAFARAWECGVKLLTEAVDDITTIDDLLAVSENHILEDVNKCVVALQEGDPDSLERTAGAIRGRANRVCSVVTQEMDNYEPCVYTKRVLEAVTVLRDQEIEDLEYLMWNINSPAKLFEIL